MNHPRWMYAARSRIISKSCGSHSSRGGIGEKQHIGVHAVPRVLRGGGGGSEVARAIPPPPRLYLRRRNAATTMGDRHSSYHRAANTALPLSLRWISAQ